jgi:hypothetical protein
MQRKFRIIPCLESEYSNGFIVVEVLLLEHEYALPENSILISDNPNISVGDVVTLDGTILRDAPEINSGIKTEEQLKQEKIDEIQTRIQTENELIVFYENLEQKANEKIQLINSNAENISFANTVIRNSNNEIRLVFLSAAVVDAHNKITEHESTIDELQRELSILQN